MILVQLVSFHGEYFGVKGIHIHFVQSHLKQMFYKIINKDIVNMILKVYNAINQKHALRNANECRKIVEQVHYNHYRNPEYSRGWWWTFLIPRYVQHSKTK
jgi:protein-S-isoprenylcysteine O-methyltransferase Ste14